MTQDRDGGKVHNFTNRVRILRWNSELWGKSENYMSQHSKNNVRILRQISVRILRGKIPIRK